MFVRVSDKINNRFYKSLVYGTVNQGYYEQAIVINPYTNRFELIGKYIAGNDIQVIPGNVLYALTVEHIGISCGDNDHNCRNGQKHPNVPQKTG